MSDAEKNFARELWALEEEVHRESFLRYFPPSSQLQSLSTMQPGRFDIIRKPAFTLPVFIEVLESVAVHWKTVKRNDPPSVDTVLRGHSRRRGSSLTGGSGSSISGGGFSGSTAYRSRAMTGSTGSSGEMELLQPGGRYFLRYDAIREQLLAGKVRLV